MIDKGSKSFAQTAASSQAMQDTFVQDEPIFTFEISGTSTVKINSDQKIVYEMVVSSIVDKGNKWQVSHRFSEFKTFHDMLEQHFAKSNPVDFSTIPDLEPNLSRQSSSSSQKADAVGLPKFPSKVK